jgi:hypothetical protein
MVWAIFLQNHLATLVLNLSSSYDSVEREGGGVFLFHPKGAKIGC